MKTLHLFVLACLGLSAVLWSGPAPAATATVSWDPSASPGVAGYRLYWGTQSRVYTNCINAGNATTVTVSTLPNSGTVYFAATAYTNDGRESVYSEELAYTIKKTNGKKKLSLAPSIMDTTMEPAGTDPTPRVQTSLHAAGSFGWIIGDRQFFYASDVEDPSAERPMEWGRVVVDDMGTDVVFAVPFRNPVVLTFPLSRNESDPFRAQIISWSQGSVRMRLVEDIGADGFHGPETFAYAAVEAGHYRLLGGLSLEARQTSIAAGTSPVYVSFQKEFPFIPVVLIQDYGDDDVPNTTLQVVTVDEKGFWIQINNLDTEEKGDATRKRNIAYIAVEPGQGDIEGMPFQAGFVELPKHGAPTSLCLEQSGIERAFVCFAAAQSFEGTQSMEVQADDAGGQSEELGVMLTEDASTAVVGFLALQWW